MKLTKRLAVVACLVLCVVGMSGQSQFPPQPSPFGQPFDPYDFRLFPFEQRLLSKHKLALKPGDRIVFMGDTFAERATLFGYFETHLQVRFPDSKLTFRNLGYSGDTPASLLADHIKGTIEYNHDSNRALNFGTMKKHLTDAKADVIILCCGMNDSFKGDAGLPAFRESLQKLVAAYAKERFNGKSAPRFVLVGPIAHEHLGGEFPDAKEHNKNIEKYTQEMRKIAEANQLPFIDMYTPTSALMNDVGNAQTRLTINGIHLNQLGYWTAAHYLMDQLDIALPRWSVSVRGVGAMPLVEKSWPAPPPPEDVKLPSSLLKYLPYVIFDGAIAAKTEHALFIDKQICLRATAQELATGPFLRNSPMQNDAEKLRLTIVEQNQEWFYKWRAVNGEYIYGRRAAPFGIKNFPGEMEQLDKNVRDLDLKIHKLNRPTKGYSVGLAPAKSPQVAKFADIKRYTASVNPPSIEEVYGQKPGMIGGKLVATAADTNEALKKFKLQDGYEINLFASEKDFPLHNPLAMAWDTKGRLWVTTLPSYPQYLPGIPPNDKILILEDTKGAGKADKCTVFADKLYLPTGLEFGDGGVYVAAQPNMLFLKGKGDVAESREVILHGFGSGDSHHAIHTFTWSPEGSLHFNEGIFHRSNVETPWGLLRQRDAAVYRFQPRSHKLETYVSYHFANPWGQVYDRWGFNFIADASGGANYNALPMTGHVEFPRQHPNMKVFTSIVRPTCGCELVSSRHFPPEAQGNFLVNNDIGFQGIKQHKIIEEGSGFTSKELEPLLFSTDPNFRPVDIKFGPDGALYIVDWYNPLIGHMQHSIRDPGRDHYHGRIWRITAKNRPLLTPVKIAGEPIAKLLDLLKEPEDRTRYRVRMELRERDRHEVKAALEKWIPKLKEDEHYEHHLLEALWVYQGINIVDEELLARLLHAKDHRARGAATRALRNARDQMPLEKVYKYLEGQVNDEHIRVRLEAVIALSFFKDARAAEIALQAVEHPTDYYLDYGLKETITTLKPYWNPALSSGKALKIKQAGARYMLSTVSTAELLNMPRSEPIYSAIITRNDIPLQARREAIDGLARLHKSDFLSELLAVIEGLDKNSSHKMPPAKGSSDDHENVHALNDLARLLIGHDHKELTAQRDRIERLAMASRLATIRQTGQVALISADRSIDRAWADAAMNRDSLLNLVNGVPSIHETKVRDQAYPKLKDLLQSKDDGLRLAAIHSLHSISSNRAEIFTSLARSTVAGKDRDACTRTIRLLPKDSWPKAELQPLADSLLAYVSKLDTKARTTPSALDAIQLGQDLAVALGNKDLQSQFSKLGVGVILIRTVPHNMVYDVAEFYVEAGQPAVIVLENNDIMPHNLVIATPGSLKEIGALAEKMASDPEAFKKGFVPNSKKVLHATRLLQSRETDRLVITAPSQPGAYVVVCTFPGHWPVMNAVMHVVPSLDDIKPADRVKYLDTKTWTVAELAGDLEKLSEGRNFGRGKELFTMRSCNQCHKIQDAGGAIGPDLNEIPKKIASGKLSRTEVLREIIEPAAVVDKKYQLVVFELINGQTVQGVIVHEDGKVIRVAKNQVEPPIEIKRGDVAERTPLPKLSIMPNGLLDRLTKDDVLDLLAFVATGGDAHHPAFRRKD